MSRAHVAGLVCLFLAAPATRAADWNGSYSADGSCYCSGTLDARVAARIVPTPLGGQSVGRVCERIGPGPGLSVADGRFDRVVYTDAQCGHGPSAAGAEPIDPVCAGSIEPGGDDCRAVGPRWNLASAYARPTREASAEATTALIGAGVMGAPAVVPVMGAATKGEGAAVAKADDEIPGRVVEIDGRRWREAPAGTPEKGPPGTRIVLDGQVYLDIEKASAEDFLPRGKASRRAASAPTRKPAAVRSAAKAPSARRAPVAARAPSPEETRSRNERLLAEARARLRERSGTAPERESAGAPVTTAAVEAPSADTASIEGRSAEAPSVDVPSIGAAIESPSGTRTDTMPADGDESSAVASAPALSDERRESAIAETADAVAADAGEDEATVSPLMQALRMPPATRASSREFGYVDAMPTSYDYGGGGMMLEGSAALPGRFRALARLGAATDYQELLLGGSWYVTPPEADRLTVVMTAGVETGRFELEGSGVSAELSDTGLYLGAASRFVVNDRFELQAGVGYSSFFEGDPIAFGGSYYHVGRRLDIVSRVEVGDNDSLGIGVRYYY